MSTKINILMRCLFAIKLTSTIELGEITTKSVRNGKMLRGVKALNAWVIERGENDAFSQKVGKSFRLILNKGTNFEFLTKVFLTSLIQKLPQSDSNRGRPSVLLNLQQDNFVPLKSTKCYFPHFGMSTRAGQFKFFSARIGGSVFGIKLSVFYYTTRAFTCIPEELPGLKVGIFQVGNFSM